MYMHTHTDTDTDTDTDTHTDTQTHTHTHTPQKVDTLGLHVLCYHSRELNQLVYLKSL